MDEPSAHNKSRGAATGDEPRGATNGDQPAMNEDWRPDIAGLRATLSQSRKQVFGNKFANPILLSSVAMDDHGLMAPDHAADLDRSLEALTSEAFEARAERLRRYLGEVDPEANRAIIHRLLTSLAKDDQDRARSIDDFQQAIERVYFGFVFTAHPTFSLTDSLQADLLSLATGIDAGGAPLNEAKRDALLERIRVSEHRPDDPMTLLREHEKAAIAIDHLHQALDILLEVTADVAAQHYPDDWCNLRPRLISMATWVGYDLDGRSDIGWSTSFERRMASAGQAITRYRGVIAKIRPLAEAKPSLSSTIALIDARLALAQHRIEDERRGLLTFVQSSDDPEAGLAALSRTMLSGIDDRLCDATQLQELLDTAIVDAQDTDALRPLWVLACAANINGLADAQTHVRINAIQLHNAVRKAVGMEHAPDDAAHKLSYFKAIAKLVAEVEPQTIHMGSVAHERATAKRVFASISLMQRFVDRAEPVRFLIAECETSFTLMTALYFAKMFGVDDQVDISPLFETRTALERGAAMLHDALANPDYSAYLKKRGRLCLQTGFSDAGRYLGQTAASNAIERIRLDLVAILKKCDLTDVEVIIFDTHGESIGRGSHPGGFADRLAYYDTEESRRRFEKAGIRLRQESSFQGGDGYLYFMNQAGALATVTRILEHRLQTPGQKTDRFYAKTGYVDEFFAAVAHFNDQVINDPCYATLLDTFGQNLAYRSGSRAVKRQFDGRGPMIGLQHPSQIRAIPHNSILQQLGILANTIGGLGFAVNRDPEAFQELYRVSDRFRRLMAMVEHAFKYTDLAVVHAYVDLFDPGFWLNRAETDEADINDEMMAVAHYMEEINIHEKLQRILRRLQRDHIHLAGALREHRRRTRREGEEPIVIERKVRDTMHLLHSLRLAAIQSLFRRAVSVPDFSDRHDTTHEDAIIHLMHLDVLPTVALLKEVFPLIDHTTNGHDYGERASYESSAAQSYADEHQNLFDPLTTDYNTIRRIGAGLTHFIGSFG